MDDVVGSINRAMAISTELSERSCISLNARYLGAIRTPVKKKSAQALEGNQCCCTGYVISR